MPKIIVWLDELCLSKIVVATLNNEASLMTTLHDIALE